MEEFNDSLNSVVQDTIPAIPSDQEEIYAKLFSLINEVKANTIPTELTQTDFDEWTGLFLASIAAIGTFLTAYYIYKDYRQNQINTSFQESIFKDLLRHYYRNFIVLHAMKIKLENNSYNSYPSEEHILKFKSLPEDLRINQFTTSTKNYDVLHRFELLLRNINTEIDVFLEHLKNPNLPLDVKQRDMKAMAFKFPMTSERILEITQTLKVDFNTREKFTAFLKSVSADNVQRKKSKEPSLESQQLIIPTRDENFFDQLDLKQDLDTDIKLEYDIIQLIPF
ncbi:hypothetical protein [Mongoliibacter ruber]|uniref:Uncharacterized protein n=1 Tax=Mongoliibacter ruber TaxID=1750599 RepID=A0A2T0WEB5_9BACT|nr:hypothetical protein [Mongoliibacter ruber]PRY84874.1 hypothetical protein CLW00_11633 [Mongoliibacter ruber]